MPCEKSDLPPQILEAVKALWEASFKAEGQAFDSARFRMLARICSAIYPEIAGSRLPRSPTDDFDREQFNEALLRFFRWSGAPWHSARPCLSAECAAEQLHAAFLQPKVQRTFLVPLDRLELYDARTHKELRHVALRKCEIIIFENNNFAEYLPLTALKRFEPRHWFEPEKYAGFHYLVLSDDEQAGAIWERNMWGIWHKTLGAIGITKLYEPVFAEPVEDVLFLILLYLLKNPPDFSEKPFAVPWVYSFTDDPFSEPPRAPDPAALSWTIAGDEDHQYEVPDRSNFYSFTTTTIEADLEERWKRLEATSNQPAAVAKNFHPLTKHFFMKAFQEEGVDEVVALISCIEATLMLPDEKYTDKLLKRYKRLVNDETAYDWLKLAYKTRNTYLHSLGNQRDTINWVDLAKCRWAVAKAVDNYLTCSAERSGENREALLRSLKR
jgi:hypothetical protein